MAEGYQYPNEFNDSVIVGIGIDTGPAPIVSAENSHKRRKVK